MPVRDSSASPPLRCGSAPRRPGWCCRPPTAPPSPTPSAAQCVAGSLRNADAVATWIAARHDPATTSVAIIAAGERWPDDTLRPAVEDLWGAGAVVAALRNEGWTDLSPEAETTAAVWDSVAPDVSATLFNCASGRELVAAGYRDDVLIAGEVNASTSVPLLRNGSFEPAD